MKKKNKKRERIEIKRNRKERHIDDQGRSKIERNFQRCNKNQISDIAKSDIEKKAKNKAY